MKERLFLVISQVMNVPFAKINEEASTETIENWDSLKHMSLILALEEEFNIAFTDEEIVTMLSVKDILKVLKSK